MWTAIEPVGRDGATGGYRRFAWTRQDHELREWFAGECATRGLDLTTDRMGNQWGWWGDIDGAVARGQTGIAIGSHLDSVPEGGAYDGPLGGCPPSPSSTCCGQLGSCRPGRSPW